MVSRGALGEETCRDHVELRKRDGGEQVNKTSKEVSMLRSSPDLVTLRVALQVQSLWTLVAARGRQRVRVSGPPSSYGLPNTWVVLRWGCRGLAAG